MVSLRYRIAAVINAAVGYVTAAACSGASGASVAHSRSRGFGPAVTRRTLIRILLVLSALITALLFITYTRILHVITYGTRPIWDDPGKPWTVIPRYHHPTANWTTLCGMHGWEPTDPETPNRILDAVLFSVELDLLEIRMRELVDVVDVFVILEANVTFTGVAKPFVFDQNRERFSFAEHKILYHAVGTPYNGSVPKNQRPATSMFADPFEVENEQRKSMSRYLLGIGFEWAYIGEGDVLLMTDTDEIPNRETVALLKHCKFTPDAIHLRMKNFVYSFDFMVDMDHWRPKAVRAPVGNWQGFYYGHQRKSDVILSDAGWHCSWCFPLIDDFIFKMTGYSHADRVTSESLLDPKRIQDVVCEGSDIFGMLPEAYTFKDLLWKAGPARKMDSMVDVPKHVLESAVKEARLPVEEKTYGYLMPGGCLRRDRPAATV